MSALRTWIAGVGVLALAAPAARAQVAFFPNVASFPNGVSMSATPVVSADRRYVRLTMNPQFTVLEGFNPFQVPAAVSGGGIGGNGGNVLGFAGLNGPMGGPGGGFSGNGFGGPQAGSGFGMDSSGFSSDFEDRTWPQASASVRVQPQSRVRAQPPKVSKRRRALAARSACPSVRSKGGATAVEGKRE